MVAEPDPIKEARENFDICMEVGGSEAFAQWAIDHGEQVLDAIRDLTRKLSEFSEQADRLLKAERLLAACRPEEFTGDTKAFVHWSTEALSAKAALAFLLSNDISSGIRDQVSSEE